jgi:hypothetical protein
MNERTEYKVTVGWGCLGLTLGAAAVVLALAAQAVVAVATVVLELMAHG